MRKKLSKGGDLRIKSPQLYHPDPSVNQAPAAPALHTGAALCSETCSAASVVPESAGPHVVRCELPGGACESALDCEDAQSCEGAARAAQAEAPATPLPCVRACGRLRLDGHLTCGMAACDERGARNGTWHGVNAAPQQHGEPAGRLLANAKPAKLSTGFGFRCTCGALQTDHLTSRPLAGLPDGSGYCILRANDRTRKIPGVMPLRQVRL